jgi:hypothetical protein
MKEKKEEFSKISQEMVASGQELSVTVVNAYSEDKKHEVEDEKVKEEERADNSG